MALVKCPECGKEVSDSAEACHNCGYGIKVHFEKTEEEENGNIAIKNEIKTNSFKKLFDTPIKKITWVIISCLVLILTVYTIKQIEIQKTIKNSKAVLDRMQTYVNEIENEISNVDYVYGSVNSDLAIDSITENLDNLNRDINLVDSFYKKDAKIGDIIDSYTNTSWEEYKQYIRDSYFISSSNRASAQEFIKERAYSSNDEMFAAQRNTGSQSKSSIVIDSLQYSSSGDNYKVYGTVTNNTSYTVKFVKVKVSMKDANDNVIDTENTYACGDEGLEPGESTKFECYIEKDSRAQGFSAVIYDYD